MKIRYQISMDGMVARYRAEGVFADRAGAYAIHQHIHKDGAGLRNHAEGLIVIFSHGNGTLGGNAAGAFRGRLNVAILRFWFGLGGRRKRHIRRRRYIRRRRGRGNRRYPPWIIY